MYKQNNTNVENKTPNTALSFCVTWVFSFLSQEGLEDPQVNKKTIKNKIKIVELSTATNNKKAQALYESLDYIRDKEYYNYFLELR